MRNIKVPKGKDEKCTRFISAMRFFLAIIEELKLCGLQLTGGKFMWCSGLNNHAPNLLDGDGMRKGKIKI